MINFNLFRFSSAVHMLETEISLSAFKQENGLLPAEEKVKIRDVFLKFVRDQCAELKLGSVDDRIARLLHDLEHNQYLDWDTWHVQMRTLRETILDALKRVYCYHYPLDRADAYWEFHEQWKPVFDKFPSALREGEHAIDCYGMDQNTASVFHCMRIAEIGLRALARERGVRFSKKPLEWANWQDIIAQIRVSLKKINDAQAGPARDAALQFYSGALGEFESFKDVYRNQVMHVRELYDAPKALHTLNSVREFMKRLSSKISENQTKQVKWGLKWKRAS